ncbi:MAG TPA: DUF2244 domain-containing protein [Albitalea sp.]|uniref:DUF2244 domain-containing protein n=1 Tax=Piscinibacter sp. TaxID=1903157 RepID=UPI002ED52444
MSATTSPGAPSAIGRPSSSPAYRFGHESSGAADEWSVEWKLKRNCSLAPRQLLGFYSVLCGLSLAIASFFWAFGARMVMPFAWVELLAVGAALLAYARHAADSESIALRDDRLTVELASGDRVERVEFQPQWVRVEPQAGDGSLVELSGQGRRVAVGRFVRPELRPQLANELRMALRHSMPGGRDGAR